MVPSGLLRYFLLAVTVIKVTVPHEKDTLVGGLRVSLRRRGAKPQAAWTPDSATVGISGKAVSRRDPVTASP